MWPRFWIAVVAVLLALALCPACDARADSVTVRVPGKKSPVGFDSPSHRCSESRSHCPAVSAASLSVPPVLAARTGGREACRFAQAVPGLSTRSSCRQRLTAWAVVVANRTAWRPLMATSQPQGAAAPLSPALQTAGAHDLIVIHQGQYNQWLRAKDALDGLAWLFCEVANKALHHPEKDCFISVPAESMAALVWCVQEHLTQDDSLTFGHVLAHRPDLAAKSQGGAA